MKKKELIGLNEPFIHVVYCNWVDLKFSMVFNDIYIAIVNGDNCKTIEELFIEFANAFKFPDYFGENWVAFDECLNDLDWLMSDGYILVIKNADHILESVESDFKILVDLLKDTAIEWSNGREYDEFPNQPTPFHIVIHSEKEKKRILIKRLRKVLSSCDFNELEV